MQSTFTLTTTNFSAPFDTDDTLVTVNSLTGIVPGVHLYAGRELMRVQSIVGVGNQIILARGRDGTAGCQHTPAETVYIGQGYQFYEQDPQGLPPTAALVNPWINIRSGSIWVIQGDDIGLAMQSRSWQPVTTTQIIGPLGVRVNVTTTPS